MLHLIINSIGRAGFSDCIDLAGRLELAPAPFIKAIYQAPHVIPLEHPEPEHGTLRQYLQQSGFDIADGLVVTEIEKRLFDIAVILDVRQDVVPVLNALSHFTGAPNDEILAMLLRPPGLILGDVSKATVDALTSRLDGLAATLLASDKAAAVYDIYAQERDHLTLRSMEKVAGATATSENPQWSIIKGLPFERANAIWHQFGHHGGVQIVNQDFQLWDIWLDAVPKDAAALDRLAAITGIPLKACQRIVQHLPIVICTSMPTGEAHDIQEKLEAESFSGRAELTTLRNFAVTLTDVEDPAQSAQLISGFGHRIESSSLCAAQLPVLLQPPMSDIAARLMQRQLAQIGCRAELEVISA